MNTEIQQAVEAAVDTGLGDWLADKPALAAAFERLPEFQEIQIAKVREHPAYILAMDLLGKAEDDQELLAIGLALVKEIVPMIFAAIGT